MAKAAGFPDEFQPPAHWDKRCAAAYLRLMGLTQVQAAKAVGRSERTLWGWEHDASWPRAIQAAQQRWLVDVGDAARRAVLTQIQEGDGELGFRVLERLDAALAPPKQRVDVDFTARVVRLPHKAPSVDAWQQTALPEAPEGG